MSGAHQALCPSTPYSTTYFTAINITVPPHIFVFVVCSGRQWQWQQWWNGGHKTSRKLVGFSIYSHRLRSMRVTWAERCVGRFGLDAGRQQSNGDSRTWQLRPADESASSFLRSSTRFPDERKACIVRKFYCSLDSQLQNGTAFALAYPLWNHVSSYYNSVFFVNWWYSDENWNRTIIG